MASRAELSELLGLLDELQETQFTGLPTDLPRTIAEIESRNLENRRVALAEVRRLVEGHTARHRE